MSDKLREAAQAALDAMSVVRVFVTTEEKIKHPEGTDWYDNIRINLDDSIVNDIKEMNALEAALAEPAIKESLTVAEQKPVGKFSKFSDGVWKEVNLRSVSGIFLYTAPPRKEWIGLAEPKQEPVAWKHPNKNMVFWEDTKEVDEYHGFKPTIPLYTAPPRREWVGLTDEEIDAIYLQHHNQYDQCQSPNWSYERAVEAKLREKNGG